MLLKEWSKPKMLTGINVNIQHEGLSYHIQTEDGGPGNPVITTLLFKDGAIFSSKKTHYKELLENDSYEEVVKRLMETQHKEMIRELCGGQDGLGDPNAEQQISPAPPFARADPEVIEDKNLEDVLPEDASSLEVKDDVPQKKKGLDALIQDYLAKKKSGKP